MRRIAFILLISIIFFVIGSFLISSWVDALPLAIIGGCCGWAIFEFKRETYKNEKKKTHD